MGPFDTACEDPGTTKEDFNNCTQPLPTGSFLLVLDGTSGYCSKLPHWGPRLHSSSAAPLYCSHEEHFRLLQGIHLPSCQPPTDHLLLCLLPLCVCNSKRLPNKDFSLTFPPLDQLPPPPGLLHHRPSSPPSPLWQAPPRSGTSGSQKWVFGQSHYNQY